MSGKQQNLFKGISFWALFLIILLVNSCKMGNPWANGGDDYPERYFHIKKLTVVPDTAKMGVDTVTVTVDLRFEQNPFTKEEFDESVLKYKWSERYLIEEDKGKTNLKMMRYFIPNDTTESLPVGIQGVSGWLDIVDTVTTLNDLFVFTIYLKRN